jgi:phage/plasmid-like protein (TIGR03299 family)
MAHEINYNEQKGTHSFVTNTEKAWHGLGQVVEKAMTAEEAISLANLDYEVEKTEIYAGIPKAELDANGQMHGGIIYSPYPEKFATYRTDNDDVLGIVGSRYEVVQNKDAFGFFDAIIDKGEAIFETAGALGKGERIFVTAKLPDDMLVNGEACNKYIILTNSHNGSSSIIAGFTTVRIVCNNTLQAALRDINNKVSIQHRTNAKEKLAEAYKVMNIASRYMNEVSDIFNKMSDTAIDEEGLMRYITKVMNPNEPHKIQTEQDEIISTRFKNQIQSIYNFAVTHPTQTTPAAKGTVWGAYNSISGYFNYIKKYKNNEQKFDSQLFGTASNKISKAFDNALVLI